MSTGQKYSGKGETTTQPDTNGSNPEQKGEISPQTAKHTLSANVFTFDELVLFDSLSDTGKTIISGLVNSGSYQPQQLSRALLHVSQMPDTASPSDVFNGESLQSILAAEEGVSTQPLNIEGCREHEAEPITIELPFFLRWQVRDQQQTANVLGAIDAIFYEFSKSKMGKQLDEDVNQMLAYSALRFSLEEIVKKAAIHRLGSYTKPKASEYLFDLPSLAIGDPTMDFAPVIHADPTECTDIDQLHEWVGTLQNMFRLQQKISDNHEKHIARQNEVDANQEAVIAQLQAQVKKYEQLLEATTRKAIRDEEDKSVPTAKHYISPALYLTGGYESEVEVVREALAEASKAKLLKVFKHITVDETEEAFFANEEYTKLQNVLARLTSEALEVAIDNHSRYDYTVRPQFYLNKRKEEHNDFIRRRDDFVDEYSVFTAPEEEGDSEQESPTPPNELTAQENTTQVSNS